MEYTHIKRKWVNIGATVAVVAALIGIAYLITDKFGDPSAETADKIDIFVPQKGSEVFVDGKRMQLTDGNNKTVTVTDLPTGEHTVLIAKEGYWPWTKTVDLRRENVRVSAFAVPTRSVASEVPAGSDEYAKAVKLFSAYRLPAPNEATSDLRKLRSKDGDMEVWVQGNLIHASWVSDDKPSTFYDPDRSACEGEVCQKWVEVIDAATPITSVSFYKERDDVLLFSTSDSIYVIEINKKGTQNFQPVYKGTSPTFVASDDPNYIYIKDEGTIWKSII